MLEEFGRDLTSLASMGMLEPLIGREEEVRKIIDILCLEGKNNPVLLGPPGVGKTTIVEGVAQIFAAGNVPEKLKNRKIFELNLNAMVSGTMYRGMLEERMEKVIKELLDQKDTILFIDEIHLITSSHSCCRADSFSAFLKPYLAKGMFTVIGATTEEEFKRFMEESEPAMARRFIRVNVG